MAVAFRLTRRPRTRQTPALIRRELERAYKSELWPYIEKEMAAQISSWIMKPRFYPNIRISGRRYLVEVKVDRRTKEGQIFWWVDRGTMNEGDPSTTYVITPVSAPTLVFDVPYHPKTLPPVPPGLGYDPNAPDRTIKTRHVDHPGIRPRRFSEKVRDKVTNRSNRQGFYRITENAYIRAFRRIPIARA